MVWASRSVSAVVTFDAYCDGGCSALLRILPLQKTTASASASRGQPMGSKYHVACQNVQPP
ncbi:hypothetical protein ACCO45_013360 [Purpureocillium lilacinum]|uniref:Uncharacterized protein n=1 Tax=Purpureocillium lilacinum TaxID=33203 RepID=A0ACC4DC55_PURLI